MPYEIISLVSRARLEAETGGKTELRFAATATLIRQYISNGDIEGAKELLNSFEAAVHEEGLHKLFPNIKAMKCRLALYSNDMDAVKEWMKVAPDINSGFIALERYRYLTKIRCYIAYEQYEAIKYYAEKCGRKYINMELGILTAIISVYSITVRRTVTPSKPEKQALSWRKSALFALFRRTHYLMSSSFRPKGRTKQTLIMYKRNLQWEEDFIVTLKKICEYRFVPIIAREGATVYEILKECADKCSKN
ncbi:MAG: hypothetical protein ACI4J4_09160 [Ruminiclostridium sp.]